MTDRVQVFRRTLATLHRTLDAARGVGYASCSCLSSMPHERPSKRRRALAALTTIIIVGLWGGPSAQTTDRTVEGTAALTPLPTAFADSTWIEMRNVLLHIDDRGVIRIERLRGQVVTDRGEPAVLDDAKSFTIRVTRGTTRLTGDDLASLLNSVVFAYDGAPLKKMRARMEGNAVVLSGTLRKGVSLPFSITATPTLEPDGRVRMHPTRTRILGINGAALMKALGLKLDNLIDLKKARGAVVEGNDILLDPTQILPPPAIEGRLESIGVVGDELVQTFVTTPLDSIFERYVQPDSLQPNFVYFRGGRLRFGKLEMIDTDLQIIDADQHDPFDLYLAKYNRQLVAGTSRNLENYGLRVVMPDFGDLGAGHSAPVAAR
jgi:hypothetical protein